MLLAAAAKARGRKQVLAAALAFVLFSGLDIIGIIFSGRSRSLLPITLTGGRRLSNILPFLPECSGSLTSLSRPHC